MEYVPAEWATGDYLGVEPGRVSVAAAYLFLTYVSVSLYRTEIWLWLVRMLCARSGRPVLQFTFHLQRTLFCLFTGSKDNGKVTPPLP